MAGLRPRRIATPRTALRRLPARVALLLGGSALVSTCYALTIRAGLGLGPLFVLQDGLARHAGFSIGTAVMVSGFALVTIAVVLRSWPGPGTLVLPVLGGVTLNLVLPHVTVPSGLLPRLAVVVAATWFMALGAAMMIRAAVGVSPYDLVMLALCRRLGSPITPTRLAMELTVLVIGWVLGGAVGIGTVVTGMLIGPGIHLWLRVLGGAPVGARVTGAGVTGASGPDRTAQPTVRHAAG